jgi:GTP-binding protein
MATINISEFLQSNTDYKNCPAPDKPEYAFIGRSNVGKSSLINMLTSNSHLAKVSAKPGKTRLINHFLIDKSWYLVDLPGYGWAQISKSERESWGVMTKNYLIYRKNLVCTFVLIDSRITPQPIDLEFMQWLGNNTVPFVIVFTKTDKQSNFKIQQGIDKYKEELFKTWEFLPQIFITSSINATGKEELIAFIKDLNGKFLPEK